MTEQIFVAREREIAQLNTFLDQALAGHGQVCFVTGEVGAGKTALVTEFARRAQAQHEDVLVAIGDCNAQTGIGDPYLPFREVLGMLTGDVERELAQGTITQENAGRLENFLRVSGQALVEMGPDLIDILVPAAGLITRAGAFVAGRAGWLDKLEALAEQDPVDADLSQSRIFEQYTRVLDVLAAQQPLVLVLDDLQWADPASINLLFHLARRVGESRVLIIGAYRPADVALGREGERHPLEPTLNEIKRYFSDVWIELGETPQEGRAFVDALLGSEPNRMGDDFRARLYQHTGGHPLFTIELLRHLQEHGAIFQDESGYWVERSAVDWDTLPARVEGVIAERVGRLEKELREALTVASVEGEDFTAEVVARVQALDERRLVHRLSGELAKQHRLVRERGVQRRENQRLSLYRFWHSLFQKYLYNSLGEVERLYLHEDVGHVLEGLYGEQTHEIAVQLAYHFVEAGLDRKAVRYLIQAGDAAAQVYAHVEASAHYAHALDLMKESDVSRDELIPLYTRLGRVLELDARYDQALATYAEMEVFARQRSDHHMELSALVHQGRIRSTINPEFNPELGAVVSDRALQLAQTLGEQATQAEVLRNLITLYRLTNRTRQAIDAGERSLTILRGIDPSTSRGMDGPASLAQNLQSQLAYTLNDLVICYLAVGDLDQADATSREARELWRELDNKPMLIDNLGTLSVVSSLTGRYDQMLAAAEEALRLSRATNNRRGESYARHRVGYAYWEWGEMDRSIAEMKESIRLSESLGFVLPQILTRADLAAVYGSLGAIDYALDTAQLALTVADEYIPVFRIVPMAVLAQLYVLRGDLAEAEVLLQEGKKDPKREAYPYAKVYLLQAEGELLLNQGRYDCALSVTDALLTDLRRYGMQANVPSVLHLQGEILLALDRAEQARGVLLEARTVAEAIGSRRSLWPILFALSRIEPDASEAKRLHRQARAIVEFIADHISPPELRASFLNLPQTGAVMDN